MHRIHRTLFPAVLFGLLLVLATSLSAAATVERVDETDLGETWFSGDEGAGDGSVAFVDGPGTPPLGIGSAQFATSDGADAPILVTGNHAGTRLADVTELSYATYRHSTSTAAGHLVPSLQLGIDANGDGGWDGRLVFEPVYQSGGAAAIATETWQTWDAYAGGEAIWWASRDIPGVCAFTCYVSWSDIVAANPDAEIVELGVKAGSGWAGEFLGNADVLTIATGSSGVTYDFEHANTLDGKEECKDGGWTTSTDPVFVNQGDCVSYFASDGRSHGE